MTDRERDEFSEWRGRNLAAGHKQTWDAAWEQATERALEGIRSATKCIHTRGRRLDKEEPTDRYYHEVRCSALGCARIREGGK